MENHRKSIGAIIILLLSTIFVQKANALTLTMEIEPTGNAWEEQRVDCIYSQNANTWVASNTGTAQWSCNNFPSGATNHSLQGIRTHDTIPIQEGKYYQGFFILRNGNINQPTPQILWNFNQSEDFDFITIEELYNDSSYSSLDWECSTSTGYNHCSGLEKDQVWNKIYMVTLQAKRTGNARFQFGTPTSQLVRSIDGHDYVFGIRKIVEYQKSGGTAEAEQKTEEASNEGETNSQQADTDNQAASQNVIGVISNILGAFGTPAGDCTLPGNLGNLNVGNLNLCQGKPPEIANIINIVGSIIIVYACYRVARNIFRIWITITAFAQGNSKGGN